VSAEANAYASAVVLAICRVHESRSQCCGRIARAFFVSMRTRGVSSTTRQFAGAGIETASTGSTDSTIVSPPSVEAAMLSRWRPATIASPSSAAVMISFGEGETPAASAAASAPPTALAALPPIPPATARPFSIDTIGFFRMRAACNQAIAAIAATLRVGSRGTCEASRPVMLSMRASSSVKVTVTLSPTPSTARPRTSKPGPTLPIEAGEKTVVMACASCVASPAS